ncbi:DUF2807 domain-containing protein [Yoonia sp. R2331]|uniref:GIN domain-containing protein n=1 Tax=Yoonia sp. R2331 TaxID=3237238 RepID=UPI0034E5EDD0
MTMKMIALSGLIVMGGALKAYADDRTYDVDGFDKIEVSSGVTLDVDVGSAFEVTADARRGDIDRLVVEVKGDTLHISREVGWGFLGSGKRDHFVVTVAMPALSEVHSSSGATATIEGATAVFEKGEATSGSSMRVSGDLGNLALAATSGSTLRAEGRCEALEAEASSGASLVADGLSCVTADLQSTSGSSIRAFATDSAELAASSGASLRLNGGADVTSRDVSSGGSVRVN